MRALIIAAALFFSVCGALLAYVAASGSGHEYDLKLVLPINTRQMPRPVPPPEVISQQEDTDSNGVKDGRAEAGDAPPMLDRPPVQLGSGPGVASESPAQQ